MPAYLSVSVSVPVVVTLPVPVGGLEKDVERKLFGRGPQWLYWRWSERSGLRRSNSRPKQQLTAGRVCEPASAGYLGGQSVYELAYRGVMADLLPTTFNRGVSSGCCCW